MQVNCTTVQQGYWSFTKIKTEFGKNGQKEKCKCSLRNKQKKFKALKIEK